MITGLIIARYQPAHITHGEVFDYAKKNGVDKLVVIKGSADKQRMPRYPFTAEESTTMVDMYLKRNGIPYELIALNDVSSGGIKKDTEVLDESDLEQHIEYAQRLISQIPKFDVAILVNPSIVRPLKRLEYPILTPTSKIHCSATFIRREYTLNGDRCEDLLLPEQVKYMDEHGLYEIMARVGQEEFSEDIMKLKQNQKGR